MMLRHADYMREYRARRKANGGKRLTVPVEGAVAVDIDDIPDAPVPIDPAAAVAKWSKGRLTVPAGHALAGLPMAMPDYAVQFLRDALKPDVREAGLFVARKNAKSAAIGIMLLAYLSPDGPLRRRGFRAGVVSINAAKSAELWRQMLSIADASALDHIRFGKVPRLAESPFGIVEFLSSDKSAGHASGFDIALADETGLMPDKARDTVSGLWSSLSARDGRLLHISIVGDNPLVRELIDRRNDDGVCVHIHAADPKSALDDEAAWRAANPTLGQIKSVEYMRAAARRALASPAEQSAFRAHDMNCPGGADRSPIVSVERWHKCASQPRPERGGPCYIGLDVGGAVSMTCAAVYWPMCGRLEIYGAFAPEPDLMARGQADGVKDRYLKMHARGELALLGDGRVTPAAAFVRSIIERLDGEQIAAVIADRYRKAEVEDVLNAARAHWSVEWRGMGSGPHGHEDVRAFQRAVEGGTLRPGENLMLESAILDSTVAVDNNGNPSLDKRRKRGRIDALSAAVLAVGAGWRATTATEPLQIHHVAL